MANNYLGKNFGQFSDAANADGIVTKYLNLQGLTDFWAKTKEYVDAQDAALFDVVNKKVNANDTAVRKHLHTITVNGENFAGYDPATPDTAPTSLDIVIGGEDIKVNHNGVAAAEGEKYAGKIGQTENNYTVREAFADVDTRLDGIETQLAEGVVSGLITTNTNGTYETSGSDNAKVSQFVTITEVGQTGNPETGDITLTLDDTALSKVIERIDDDIATLTANAGVTNIAVLDKYKDSDSATDGVQNLVEIVLAGSKDPIWSYPEGITSEEDKAAYRAQWQGDGAKRGDILISLDETKLDERLDGIDVTITTGFADLAEDIENLAGTGYTSAKGDTAGVWNTDVKYNNITALSERIAQIDANLVTTITVQDVNANNAEHPNWVEFTKADTAASGDNAVTLKVDETKLGEYIAQNEDNLSALGGLTINGHQVITATAGEGNYAQVTMSHTDVVLTTEDITRPLNADSKQADGFENLEETLNGYDSKIAALASATHFRGVKGEIPTTAYEGLDYGDIIIVGNKEFIYNADPEATGYEYSTTHWVEIGDVEEEQTRLENLEDWVDNNIISATEIANLGKTGDANAFNFENKPTFTWDATKTL